MFKKIIFFYSLLFLVFSCDLNGSPVDTKTEEKNIKEYSVVYDLNGASYGTVPESQSFVENSVVLIPKLHDRLFGPIIRDNISQVFLGWSFDKDSDYADFVEGDTFEIEDDKVLFAVFTKSTSVIRKNGPAGGLVFYDKGLFSDGWRYIECAPEDLKNGARMNLEYTYFVNSANIGGGLLNSSLFVRNSAIERALKDYSLIRSNVVYSEWFVPSIGELDEIYIELKSYGFGYFANDFYWSSTVSKIYDKNSLFSQDFESGKITRYTPVGSHYFAERSRVRLIRYF
ncbi:MAG: hypothetical protein JXR63_08305 [Spirochaetales bacterium]|nr:hypothetical protein [Spirochaetales bacterium]